MTTVGPYEDVMDIYRRIQRMRVSFANEREAFINTMHGKAWKTFPETVRKTQFSDGALEWKQFLLCYFFPISFQYCSYMNFPMFTSYMCYPLAYPFLFDFKRGELLEILTQLPTSRLETEPILPEFVSNNTRLRLTSVNEQCQGLLIEQLWNRFFGDRLYAMESVQHPY